MIYNKTQYANIPSWHQITTRLHYYYPKQVYTCLAYQVSIVCHKAPPPCMRFYLIFSAHIQPIYRMVSSTVNTVGDATLLTLVAVNVKEDVLGNAMEV